MSATPWLSPDGPFAGPVPTSRPSRSTLRLSSLPCSRDFATSPLAAAWCAYWVPAADRAPSYRFESIHAARLAAGDVNGAAAAAVAAVTSVWIEGHDFTAMTPWVERINDLVVRRSELHPAAVAALAQCRLLAGLLGDRPLDGLLPDLPLARRAADDSRSQASRAVCMALEGAIYALAGSLHRATECLRDALLLADADPPDLLALLGISQGAAVVSSACAQPPLLDETDAAELLERRLAEHHSTPARDLLRCHRLQLLVHRAPASVIDGAAAELRATVVPHGNRHLCSHLHLALGVAALLQHKPAEALDHSHIATEFGAGCASLLAQAQAALLEVQSLADLRQDPTALARIDAWLPRWNAAGYRLMSAAGLLERAALHLRAGRVAEARSAAALARETLPAGAALPDLHRPPGFALGLLDRLLPSTVAPIPRSASAVSVKAFGELRVSIGKDEIFDRHWHGNRTKCLLKAMIVLGGHKVSMERLCDLLWPDAEGDHAIQNLKVALSRLRHLGVAGGASPPPWICTQHGQVSLVSALCEVDAIDFRERVMQARAAGAEALSSALDLYRADFLVNDDSEAWIVAHRESLRHLFVRGAHDLARDCLACARPSVAQPYLERAIEIEPLDLGSYAWLARMQVASGNAAGARLTGIRARAAFAAA